MLRSDFIHILQGRNPHLRRSTLEAAVKEILDHMTENLAAGGRIEVCGFGSFTLYYHPAAKVEILKPESDLSWTSVTGFTSSQSWTCGSG